MRADGPEVDAEEEKLTSTKKILANSAPFENWLKKEHYDLTAQCRCLFGGNSTTKLVCRSTHTAKYFYTVTALPL